MPYYIDERTLLVDDGLILQNLAKFHREFLIYHNCSTGSNGKQQPKNLFKLFFLKNSIQKQQLGI
jgi:hypothetical protein